MYVTLGGRRYRVVFESRRASLGECDPPDQAGKKIRLDPHPMREEVPAKIPRSMARLWLVIHESLHALNWDTPEETVQQWSTELVWFINRLQQEGYLPGSTPRHLGSEPACTGGPPPK